MVARVPHRLPCSGCAWAGPSAHALRGKPVIHAGSCTTGAQDVCKGSCLLVALALDVLQNRCAASASAKTPSSPAFCWLHGPLGPREPARC